MSFKTRIRNKRDTASNWETNNPVLLDGELIVVDTNAGDIRFKIGDGTKTYTQLPFQDEVVYNALSGKAEAKDLTALESAVDTLHDEFDSHKHSWEELENKPFGGTATETEVFSSVVPANECYDMGDIMEVMFVGAPSLTLTVENTYAVVINGTRLGDIVCDNGTLLGDPRCETYPCAVMNNAVCIIDFKKELYNENGDNTFVILEVVNDITYIDDAYIPGTIARTEDVSGKMSKTDPIGTGSFAMNPKSVTNIGQYAHIEGYHNKGSALAAHAEGRDTEASEDSAHAEGYGTIASGEAAHAEGFGSVAAGGASHAEGRATIASADFQHVQGKFNLSNPNYAHIVGNGEDDQNRSNAHTVDWDGNAWYAGKLKLGGSSYEDGDEVALKSEVDGEIELLQTAVEGKQDKLTFDEVPTEDSINHVTSGGVKRYVDSAIESNKPRVYADHIILTDSVNGFDYVVKMVNGNLVSSALATAISISEPPSNTTFYDGDTIDLSDMKLVATCSDGSTRELTDYTYEPTVATEGTTVVTISYGEGANTFTAELNVVCESLENKLVDFRYVKNSDGTYTLTGWKQTLNGQSSTRMIVPNSSKVII